MNGDVLTHGIGGGAWGLLTGGLCTDVAHPYADEVLTDTVQPPSDTRHWARAVAFPFLLLPGGDVNLAEDERAVYQNIEVTLMTDQGSWYGDLSAGSRVSGLVFEPNDEVTRELVDLHLRDALDPAEPRAVFHRTNMTPDEHSINVLIPFSLRATGQTRSVKIGVPIQGG